MICIEISIYCLFKGEVSYYSVIIDVGDIVDDVMWMYENFYLVVVVIVGYVVCYLDKVEISIFLG